MLFRSSSEDDVAESNKRCRLSLDEGIWLNDNEPSFTKHANHSAPVIPSREVLFGRMNTVPFPEMSSDEDEDARSKSKRIRIMSGSFKKLRSLRAFGSRLFKKSEDEKALQ